MFCSCPSSDPIRFFRPPLRPALAFNGVDSIRRVSVSQSVSQSVSPQVEAGTGQQDLQEVERVRMVFPETWLWTNLSAGYSCLLSQTPPRSLYQAQTLYAPFLGGLKILPITAFLLIVWIFVPSFFFAVIRHLYRHACLLLQVHRSHEDRVMATDYVELENCFVRLAFNMAINSAFCIYHFYRFFVTRPHYIQGAVRIVL